MAKLNLVKNQAFQRWNEIATLFHSNEKATVVFEQLFKNYTQKHRAYHNIYHILDLLEKFETFQTHIQQKNIVLLAIWFHDAIYEPLRTDNEEKSALLSLKYLKDSHLKEEEKQQIAFFITSTKSHIASENQDLQYFLDLDLSILGAEEHLYFQYAQKVRKEFWIVPSFFYKPKRKKVLENFLQRPTLYFSQQAQELWEKQARQNLQSEIQQL